MAYDLKKLQRVFKYKERTLSDPDTSLTPDEVMAFYSNQFPELTTSNVHGPQVQGTKAVYEFKTNVGTKG